MSWIWQSQLTQTAKHDVVAWNHSGKTPELFRRNSGETPEQFRNGSGTGPMVAKDGRLRLTGPWQSRRQRPWRALGSTRMGLDDI